MMEFVAALVQIVDNRYQLENIVDTNVGESPNGEFKDSH